MFAFLYWCFVFAFLALMFYRCSVFFFICVHVPFVLVFNQLVPFVLLCFQTFCTCVPFALLYSYSIRASIYFLIWLYIISCFCIHVLFASLSLCSICDFVRQTRLCFWFLTHLCFAFMFHFRFCIYVSLVNDDNIRLPFCVHVPLLFYVCVPFVLLYSRPICVFVFMLQLWLYSCSPFFIHVLFVHFFIFVFSHYGMELCASVTMSWRFM